MDNKLNQNQKSADRWEAPKIEPTPEELIQNIADLESAQADAVDWAARNIGYIQHKWYVYHEGYVYYISQGKVKELKRARCDGKEIITLHSDCKGLTIKEISNDYVYLDGFYSSSEHDWDRTSIWYTYRIKIDGSDELVLFSRIEEYSDMRETDRTEYYLEEEEALQAAISNQSKLWEIAQTARTRSVRINAIKNITDEGFLKEIVRKTHGELCKEILETYKNQCKETEESGVIAVELRHYAMENITDENFLEHLVRNEKDMGLRNIALGKITDENFLKDIATNKNESDYTRSAAIKNISDEKFLRQMANDEEFLVRNEALKNITNQDFLKDKAKNDNLYLIRRTAVKNISDEDFLEEIAGNDESEEVREAAKERIKELQNGN